MAITGAFFVAGGGPRESIAASRFLKSSGSSLLSFFSIGFLAGAGFTFSSSSTSKTGMVILPLGFGASFFFSSSYCWPNREAASIFFPTPATGFFFSSVGLGERSLGTKVSFLRKAAPCFISLVEGFASTGLFNLPSVFTSEVLIKLAALNAGLA